METALLVARRDSYRSLGQDLDYQFAHAADQVGSIERAPQDLNEEEFKLPKTRPPYTPGFGDRW